MNETQGKILEVASQLMTQNGIKETSLSNIAKATGISKGTLYYYYSSKDDIIYDIAEIHLNNMTKELLKWIEGLKGDLPLNDVIHVVIQKIIESETRGKLHLYLINSSILHNDELRERFKTKYHEWRQTLKEGICRVSKVAGADSLAHILLAVLDGLTIQSVLGIQNLPYEQISKALAEIS